MKTWVSGYKNFRLTTISRAETLQASVRPYDIPRGIVKSSRGEETEAGMNTDPLITAYELDDLARRFNELHGVGRKLTHKERLQAARHEAGHTILFLLKGIKFYRVVVMNVTWKNSNGQVNSPDFISLLSDIDGGDIDAEKRDTAGVSLMAGLAGERVGRSCGSAFGDYAAHPHIGDDLGMIYESLDFTPDGQYHLSEAEMRRDIDDWLKTAHTLLQKHADIHRRLTDALIERGLLTYDECQQLFRGEVPTVQAVEAAEAAEVTA